MTTVTEKPVIYQLVVRYFGNINQTNKTDGTIAENGVGKFDDINDTALAQLKELGCSHLFLTGCIRQATLTSYPELNLEADDADIVKGRAGSMYAIRDYFDVCPDYAKNPAKRMQEFEALIERIHKASLKAIIDFVPNHVARSYHSLSESNSLGREDDQSVFFSAQNNFFYLVEPPGQKLTLERPPHWQPEGTVFDGQFALEDGTAGRTVKATGNNVASNQPPVDAWYEVIKLNYGFNFVDDSASYDPLPKTWQDMNAILKFWQSKGVDGFRCDFAHYIPSEAWRYLIENARAKSRNPDTYFIAEAYPWSGSGDPITRKSQLIEAGFDAIYSGESYRLLKNIYQQTNSLDDYDREMNSLDEREHAHSINYIENHDEVRVAAPIAKSGFGSLAANFQLAPLQYLYGPGAVMILNGQEVGEPGAGNKGFSTEDGRTSIFDYWCMPEFAKWVNQHNYDGALLSYEQQKLRNFLRDLIRLCQDKSIRGSGYWGLKYFNRASRFADCPDDLYSFARYEPTSGRLVIVVANFSGSGATRGKIRIPAELAAAVHLNQRLSVNLLLDENGAAGLKHTDISLNSLIEDGYAVQIASQASYVFSIE